MLLKGPYEKKVIAHFRPPSQTLARPVNFPAVSQGPVLRNTARTTSFVPIIEKNAVLQRNATRERRQTITAGFLNRVYRGPRSSSSKKRIFVMINGTGRASAFRLPDSSESYRSYRRDRAIRRSARRSSSGLIIFGEESLVSLSNTPSGS